LASRSLIARLLREGGERARELALCPQDIAELVVGDGEVALPIVIAGLNRGQALHDRNGLLRGLLALFAVALLSIGQ
jgi:hypothetical protein